MKSDDPVDGPLSVVVQLALIACLGAIAVWAWPSGILIRPLSLLTVGSVFWALVSLAIWFVALAWLYFLVEPLFKRNAGDAF